MLYVICLVYIVYFSFFSTVAAYMANKVVYILSLATGNPRAKPELVVEIMYIFSSKSRLFQLFIFERTKLHDMDSLILS